MNSNTPTCSGLSSTSNMNNIAKKYVSVQEVKNGFMINTNYETHVAKDIEEVKSIINEILK